MATITVGTNSYVTEAELTTYATDRGITITAADKTVLLIKAMDYLEVKLYKGYKTVSTQALQFPRVLCADIYSQYPQGYIPCEYDSDTVPDNVKKAQIVAALLIDSGENIQADIAKATIREKIDVIEVEYASTANETTIYTQLNDLLSPFIANGGLKLSRA